jgi:hypothetical protein
MEFPLNPILNSLFNTILSNSAETALLNELKFSPSYFFCLLRHCMSKKLLSWGRDFDPRSLAISALWSKVKSDCSLETSWERLQNPLFGIASLGHVTVGTGLIGPECNVSPVQSLFALLRPAIYIIYCLYFLSRAWFCFSKNVELQNPLFSVCWGKHIVPVLYFDFQVAVITVRLLNLLKVRRKTYLPH